MPARRSTRNGKKKEVEALSSRPGIHSDSPDSMPSSQKLDEPNGPAPVIAAKTTSLTTKKKSSKKTADLPKQLKVSGDRKDGHGHKDSEQEDTIHVVEKKSVADVGKILPIESHHHMADRHNSEQNQKHNPRRGRVVKADKAGKCQKDGLPVSSRSKSKEKESDEKETAPPGAVKPAPRADRKRQTSANSRSNPTSDTPGRDVEPKPAPRADRKRDTSVNSRSNPTSDTSGRDLKPKPAPRADRKRDTSANSRSNPTSDTPGRDVEPKPAPRADRKRDTSANSRSNPTSDTPGRDVKPKPAPRADRKRDTSANSRSNPTSDTPGRDVKPKPAKNTTDRMVDSSFTTTEDFSSSDSDFEEVSSKYRTPESSLLSSTCSDSGIFRKLEDSFSDCRNSQGLSFSVSSSDVTDFSSPVCTMQKRDSDITKHTRDTGTTNKGQAGGKVSSKAAKASTPGSSGSKRAATGSKKLVQKKAGNSESEHTKAKGKKKSIRAEDKASKSGQTGTAKEMDENNIMAILMKMEGQPSQTDHSVPADQPSTSGQSRGRKVMPMKKTTPHKSADADSTDESDWEEVEDYKHSPPKSQIPEAPVEITIDDPALIHRKRKKKEFDWKAYVQRKIKRMAREMQIEMHKVHLLCLLSHGLRQSGVCSDVTVCATALSILPHSQLQKDVAFYDDHTLLFFLKWFRSTFCLSNSNADESSCSLVTGSQLLRVIQEGTAGEARLLVMVLAAMLRAMGFNVRLVIALQPLPLKSSSAALGKGASKRKTNDRSEIASTSSKKPKQVSGSQKTTDTGNPSHKSTKYVGIKSKSTKSQSTKRPGSDPKTGPSTSTTNQSAKSANKSAVRKRKRTTKSKNSANSSSSEEEDDDDDGPSVAKRRASERVRMVVKPSAKDHDGGCEDGDDISPSDGSNFSEEEEEVVMRRRRGKAKGKGKGKKQSGLSGKASAAGVDEEFDGEFDRSFQVKSLLVKDGKSSKKANRKVLSEDSDEEEVIKSKGRDYWLEVYLPRQSKWFCVDCIRCTVGRPYDSSAAASQPILYVLGFENDGSVKDITAKYAPQWLSHTRKHRVDSDWWRESLEAFASQNTVLDDLENRDIKEHLVQRPLPTNIGDFKNHPLYALRRHLLKYEAIYPENSIPVGYIRQEPVYARECVHTLHSRDNWLKEARLVRLGETPYKVVKSRKRWNRARDNPVELDLELFGRWQTEDYIAPPAVDGKVPKNEYGNVELFQPSMIPGGTVHIRVPALNRVARKLGIDIAAAMTGWDHHCGYSHPVLDGWIVCEEHKEVLLAAWEEDQEIQRVREEERREKRVMNNWTTLVRGLLIKEKLKKRFNLEEKPSAEVKVKKRGKGKKGEKATDVQHAWPARQQQRRQMEQTEKAAPPAPSHFTVETM